MITVTNILPYKRHQYCLTTCDSSSSGRTCSTCSSVVLVVYVVPVGSVVREVPLVL